MAKIRFLLLISSLYLAAIGLALMIFPAQFGIGAVPEDAPPALLALMRLLGGPFLGIAALNWLSRRGMKGGPLRIVLTANFIGFAAVAANDIWGVASGEARDLARIFLIIHLGFAGAFLLSLRRNA